VTTPEPVEQPDVGPAPSHDRRRARSVSCRERRTYAAHCAGQIRVRGTVLRDGGKTYPSMLAALSGARRSICIETISSPPTRPAIGSRASDGAREPASRSGSSTTPSDRSACREVRRMRDAGVQVIDFNPIAPWRRRFQLSHRDHRRSSSSTTIAFTGAQHRDGFAAVSDEVPAGTTCTAA
jgi:hypothetical protein